MLGRYNAPGVGNKTPPTCQGQRGILIGNIMSIPKDAKKDNVIVIDNDARDRAARLNFLKAMLGDYWGDVLVGEAFDHRVRAAGGLLADPSSESYICPLTPDGDALCVYAVRDGDPALGPQIERALKPTATLKSYDTTYEVWVFKEPDNSPEALELARVIQPGFGKGSLPLPGVDGFELTAFNPGRRCVLSDVKTAVERVPAAPPDKLTCYDHIVLAIEALPVNPTEAHLADIIQALAKLTDPAQISLCRAALKKRSGLTLADIKKAEAKHRTTQPDSGGLRQGKNGGPAIFEHAYELDEFDAVHAVATVTLAANGDRGPTSPNVTWSAAAEGLMRFGRSVSGEARFSPYAFDRFQADLNGRLAFVQLDDNGMPRPRKFPPRAVAKTFYDGAGARDRLPTTPEIARTPIFLASGALVSRDGWDVTNALYVDLCGLKIDAVPPKPTKEQVGGALADLKDLLGQFDFHDKDLDGQENGKPGYAAALAMLLTLPARRLFSGPSPLFFPSKAKAGTGGTLLGGLPARIFEGHDPVPMPFSPNNDEENQKVLIAATLEGRSILFYDDVKNFNSRALIQAITSGNIGGRLLGGSTTVTAPNKSLWVATGNNPRLNEEMQRRTLMIRLAATTADLNNRKFTKRTNKANEGITFEAWVIQERAKFIRALLVLVQNWIAKGKPLFTKRGLTSFEGWAGVVGGILQCAGVEGFLTAKRQTAFDPEFEANSAFVTAWWKEIEAANGEKAKAEKREKDLDGLLTFAGDRELAVVIGFDKAERLQKLQARLADLNGAPFVVQKAVEVQGQAAVEAQVRCLDGGRYQLAVLPPPDDAADG
jgi:hypothetical protein